MKSTAERSFLTRLFWTAYQGYHMIGQAQYPFKPLAAIKRDQSRRVQNIVAYAYRYVPYYRETMKRLGLRPSDFRHADDLAKLPLLEREQLRRDPLYFVSTAQSPHRYLSCLSAGSTGIPCTVYHDARSLFQSAAYRERERSIIAALVGRSFGYRETAIANTSPHGSINKAVRFCRELGISPRGVRVERQVLSLFDPPEVNTHLINDFKPDLVNSYGSYFEFLFSYLVSTKTSIHRPKVITYSSDMLSKQIRTIIENGFGIPVFSVYHSIEAFGIAFECECHQGVHLNIDLYPVRIIGREGKTLKTGESGEVIISNLVNRATVLLNYRLGDRAAVLPDRCKCGRSLPLLTFPLGRNNDCITLPSGQVVHWQSLVEALKTEENIWQYQIVQHHAAHLTVKIIAAENCDRQKLSENITKKLASILGEVVTIEIDFVDSIERTNMGKLRTILSMREGMETRAPGTSYEG